MFRRLRNNLHNRCLLSKLKQRHKTLTRALEQKHYPVKWLTIGSVISRDITAYLTYEGKGKHDYFELISILYEPLKSAQSQINLLSSTAVIISIYIATYVYGITFPITIAGFTLAHDPIVLSVSMTIMAFLGLKISYLFMNVQYLKQAIQAIIDHGFDPQLGEILRSAFLYFDNGKFYESKSNPRLLVTKPVSTITAGVSVISFVAIIAFIICIWYIHVKALLLLLNSAINGEHALYFILLFITISFDIAALVVVIATIFPIRYKDWSANSRFEVLDQLNPAEADRFRAEVFPEEIWRIKRAIDKIRARI